MKLTFFGAAHAVTGSCHCLEVNGKKILIDCGLQQGRDEQDNHQLQFNPNEIDYVFVTHAHIDHSGRVPFLVKMGYTGQIFTTRLTAELLSIMLRDSAHIQESDAQWKNQKGKRAGEEPVEPLYTLMDAEDAISKLVHFEYETDIDLCEGVRVRFLDAGHLLGSSIIEFTLTEHGETRKVVFSGDLGNIDQPIIRDPSFAYEADYVVMESTYGDRNHESSRETEDYTERLAVIIDETFSRGGNVIIPAFAVGRTQELLYAMREMKDRGLVKHHPNFSVCLDSPLAIEATKIFSGDLRGYLDEEALAIIQGGENLFTFEGLSVSTTSEESKMLNFETDSKVIISASGMCDAGRIRHHLKHNLWRRDSSIVFVGYQGEGTLGRHLLEGAENVKLFGEHIAVNAKIYNFKGMSSHADRDHLIHWVSKFSPKPQQVFVVHGDTEVTEIFAETLRQKQFGAHAVLCEESYDLIKNCTINTGYLPQPKRAKKDLTSPLYYELETVLSDVQSVLQKYKKGAANRDLKKMKAQLLSFVERWND